jgi:hypothetical protein
MAPERPRTPACASAMALAICTSPDLRTKVICLTYRPGALSQGRASLNPQETEIDSTQLCNEPQPHAKIRSDSANLLQTPSQHSCEDSTEAQSIR